MSDEIQQKMTEEVQQEAVANVKPTDELAPEELSDVNGGGIVKTVDKSSPKLFNACVTGSHFPAVTIE
jgi:type VI protein secretion system component Hcp